MGGGTRTSGCFGVAGGASDIAPPFAAGTAIPGLGANAGRAIAGMDCW
ncbi:MULTISPECIES: hypothetical protein [Corallococcus]|nr:MULTISPECIES: hypothetical protein [Corallococcus]NBD09501.1 hypothetical protein [Corallococcus silvisoli]